MRFAVHIVTDMMEWQWKNWRLGRARYPYVLMLEPSVVRHLGSSVKDVATMARWNFAA